MFSHVPAETGVVEGLQLTRHHIGKVYLLWSVGIHLLVIQTSNSALPRHSTIAIKL